MKTTERLILRKPEKQDFERFFEINKDPQTNLYNPSGPMSLEKAENTFNRMLEHWDQYNFGGWAILEKENPDRVIGFGGLSYKMYDEEEKLNLGYRFAPEAWGKGYATEAANYFKNIGFKNNVAESLISIIDVENFPSQRVAERNGMKREKHLEWMKLQVYIYRIDKDEWKKNSEAMV